MTDSSLPCRNPLTITKRPEAATSQALLAGSHTPGSVAHVVDAARMRAHEGVRSLLPAMDGPVELLGLSPAATMPAHERAFVTTIDGARAMRAVSHVQRAEAEHILRTGNIDPEPIAWVGGYGNGNGAMPIVRVTHPDSPHVVMRAVHRPITAQAAQEHFFARLTQGFGVDHSYAPVGRRDDGSALVALVPGRSSWDEGVNSGDDIRGVLEGSYRMQFPSLSVDDARLAARIDHELITVPHYVAAQPDLNAGGILADRASGALHVIDTGLAGRGEGADVLVPSMKSHFLGRTPGHVELHPRTVAALAAIDDEALTSAHGALREPAGALPSGHAGALAEDASDAYLERLRTRLDHAARSGEYRYTPMDLNADPIHQSWRIRTGQAG